MQDLRSFETGRLRCEAIELRHQPELTALLNDPAVVRTLSADGAPPAWGARTEEIALQSADWGRYGFGLWLLRDRMSGEFVGRGGMQHTSATGHDEVEIAYAIRSERWNEGFATEIALACAGLAFGVIGLEAVIAFTLPHNRPSRRVMEKAGMSYQRDFVHKGLPHVLYRRDRW